jgi:hypothetical protein
VSIGEKETDTPIASSGTFWILPTKKPISSERTITMNNTQQLIRTEALAKKDYNLWKQKGVSSPAPGSPLYEVEVMKKYLDVMRGAI